MPNIGLILPYCHVKKPVFFLWLLFIMASLNSLGQIIGRIKEKETGHNCSDASVYLFRADTFLLNQTHSYQDGTFVLSSRPLPGHYIMLVSAPALESLYQNLVLTDTLPVDVGVLFLSSHIDSLQAIIVRSSILRPQLKGDTVEYNTGNIKMRPNADVEEMLRRLPGLQVDVKGNLTYNGEKISHLLVDGEEFFGPDPALVTKNFDASRIEKVQILDRKSDQAIFTGIDDGMRTKTINLVMKRDSKNGYFGKVEGGIDPRSVYSVDGLLAAFEQHKQIAAIGFASNTGTLGFSTDVGGSPTGIFSNNNTGDPLGASSGTGIPRFLGSALHYADTWKESSGHIVGNYQYSNLYSQPETVNLLLQTLPDTIYNQYQRSHSTNQQQQQWAFATFDGIIDSLSTAKILSYASSTTAQNQYGDTSSSAFNGVNANSSLRSIRDNVNRQDLHLQANYRLRARCHPARVFTLSVNWSGTSSTTNGYLYSLNRFYPADSGAKSLDTTDQRKLVLNRIITLGSGITYTEPVWAKATLGFAYDVNYDGNDEFQGTYDKGDGKYKLQIDSLSSHFLGQTFNQQASVNLQGCETGLNYTFGTGIQRYFYKQQDLQAGSISRHTYWNLIPHFRISYAPDHFTHVIFNYSGTPQQPTISQLQPIINNSNPLFVTLGNPNLRPSFNQGWSLNLSRAKAWIYNLSFNFGLVSNSISIRTITNSLGQQISQPVNVNGGKNLGANLSVHKRISALELGFNIGESYARSVTYANTDLNKTSSCAETGGISIGYYSAEKYSLELNGQWSYLDTRNSVDVSAPIHYWTQSNTGNLTIFLVPTFEIHTDATYNWQQSTSAFAGNTSELLWSASILRNFLDNRLVIKFLANNLLNVNAGIIRTSSANVNSQSSTNILGRYWLLTAAYHLDHKWKKR